MTITVVCGQGHVTKYNLVSDKFHSYWENEQGHVVMEEWTEHWKCPVHDCAHKEYISHVINKLWTETHGEEETDNNRVALAALLLLSLFLSIKMRIAI